MTTEKRVPLFEPLYPVETSDHWGPKKASRVPSVGFGEWEIPAAFESFQWVGSSDFEFGVKESTGQAESRMVARVF